MRTLALPLSLALLLLSACGKKSGGGTYLEIGGAKVASITVEFREEFTDGVEGEISIPGQETLSFDFSGSPEVGLTYTLPKITALGGGPAGGSFDGGKAQLKAGAYRDSEIFIVETAKVKILKWGTKEGETLSFEFEVTLEDGKTFKGSVETVLLEHAPQMLY